LMPLLLLSLSLFQLPLPLDYLFFYSISPFQLLVSYSSCPCILLKLSCELLLSWLPFLLLKLSRSFYPFVQP
jgi:hypothetical protein